MELNLRNVLLTLEPKTESSKVEENLVNEFNSICPKMAVQS